MAMTRFEDQLFDDLIREHGGELAVVTRPAVRRPGVPRPVWLVAAAAGVAGAVIVGATVAGGGTPVYAVTRGADGVVTVSLRDISGLRGANDELHRLGIPAVAVPIRDGCTEPMPQTDSPVPGAPRSSIDDAPGSPEGAITFSVKAIPAGDTAVLAAGKQDNGMMAIDFLFVRGSAPTCLPVTHLPDSFVPMSGDGTGSVDSGIPGQKLPGAGGASSATKAG